MGRRIDLTGQRYGRLSVIRLADRRKVGRTFWLCRCDCGKETEVISTNLRSGNTKSCGCLGNEHLANFGKLVLPKVRSHGLSGHPTYKSWSSMIQRCLNPNHVAYDNYGGRGISCSDRWKVFDNFVLDMGLRPDGYSLDRINNDDGYHAGNCIWSNWTAQGRNKRNNKLTEHAVKHIHILYGQGLTQSKIAERYNLSQSHVSMIVNHKRWTDQLDTE